MHKMDLRRLLLMAALHFGVMYALMYAMVNSAGEILPNINNLYMAGLMTAPMVVLEGLLKGAMYQNKAGLALAMGVSAVVFLLAFGAIRQQAGVNNREFLRSMIPHHSGAILMCREAKIADAEIQELCETIIVSQQSEIDQMQGILGRLE